MGRDPQPKKPRKSSDGISNPSTPRKLGYNDYSFARIELDRESKDKFKALCASNEFTDFEQLTTYVDGGYKVSFNQDANGKGVICSVACHSHHDPNFGLILTGRGITAAAAWNVFRFKSVYLCEDEIWATGYSSDTDEDYLK